MNIKAFIFDMDGVVVDSTKQDFLAWKKTFSNYKKVLLFKQYQKFLGMKNDKIILTLINNKLTDDEVNEIADRKEQYFLDAIRQIHLKPTQGLVKLLKSIRDKGYKIGLGTAAPLRKAKEVLRQLGLTKMFDKIVTAEEVREGKPNPETYLKVAEKLAVEPKFCVVIEDAPNGILASKRAGMRSVAITTTHSKDQLKDADFIIDSFDQLRFRERSLQATPK